MRITTPKLRSPTGWLLMPNESVHIVVFSGLTVAGFVWGRGDGRRRA
jgi:hypothetical protein